MSKWKYSIEAQRFDGTWSRGTIWACYPGCFRELLYYINGENDPCTGRIVVKTNGPSTRIRRASDEAESDFSWPEDKMVWPLAS